ncbi:Hypothetical protein, putative [Bodo saltans]|uniref:Uncharacterized protein n=1 Tax=Bodo saltans TaxID=75058 RepID=A0A0S4JX24_BODSA|nr:Hypothetical protein, putative [Bodo saltans]|eukprot:CUG93702.1 Hypothetical protein, putative [Bodo saltans]
MSDEHADISTGPYTLEVVCLPKLNAVVVVPQALFEVGGGATYIAPGDIIAPTARMHDKPPRVGEVFRELGYAACSYFCPPKNGGYWQVKLMFRYLKMDIAGSAFGGERTVKYRSGERSIELKDTDIGQTIPLSSSSFLRIMPADPNAVENLRFEPFSHLHQIANTMNFDHCGDEHLSKGAVQSSSQRSGSVQRGPRRALTRGWDLMRVVAILDDCSRCDAISCRPRARHQAMPMCLLSQENIGDTVGRGAQVRAP